MLCISRGVEEEIKIGNNITVKVLEIRGNIVSLGIQAPKEVLILRDNCKNKEPKKRQ